MSSISSSDDELRRQKAVEQRFFRRKRGDWKYGEDVARMQKIMELHRTGMAHSDIHLTFVPGRVAIVAEGEVNEHCFGSLVPNHCDYLNHGSPFEQAQDIRKYGSAWPTWITRPETATFSSLDEDEGPHRVTYKQKVNPHKNHKGDYIMGNIGNYDDIRDKLSALTKNDPGAERRLASLLLVFPYRIVAISASDLAETLEVEPESIALSDVAFINDLGYLLFIKEIARRQAPADARRDLPWASSILRALRLVQAGRLALQEVLSKDAPYGVSTGINICHDLRPVKRKIKAINHAYRECFPETPLTAPSKHPERLATARSHMREELAYFYGGGSSTDIGGYESERLISDL